MKHIFISFPYTHTDNKVTLERVQKAREYCYWQLSAGNIVYAPAIFGHDLMHGLNLTTTEENMSFKNWEQFCYSYLFPCDELHLLTMEGWDTSTGCAGEQLKAAELNIPIILVNP